MPEVKKIAIIAAGGVIFAIALGIGAKYGLQFYRTARERRAVTMAHEFFQQRDYRNAVLAAKRALTYNHTNPQALYLMAELAKIGGSPLELEFRQRLAEVAPSISNQLAVAECAIRLEKPPYPIATATLDRLAESGKDIFDYRMLAAKLSLLTGSYKSATEHLEHALRIAPTNKLALLNLLMIRAVDSDKEVAEEARAKLQEFSEDPEFGLQALRSLVAIWRNEGDFTRALLCAKALITNANSEFSDRLLYLSCLYKVDERAGDAYLAALKRSAQTNLALIVQLIGWLNSNGRAHETIQWVESLPSYLRETVPIQMAVANACMALKDWPQLQARLEKQQWADHEYLRLAFLSRAFREQRRSELSAPVWQRAVSEAARRPENLLALSQLAAGWGWQQESESLLLRVARNYPQYRWLFNVLQEIYMKRGETISLARLFQTWLETTPGMAAVKNNYAAVMLLLNQDLNKAFGLAREAYASDQTNVVFASTYAFALFKRGEFQSALEILNRFDETELKQGAVAGYYAVILQANGFTEKAREYAQVALGSPLLPEERALFESVLQSN